MTHTTAKHLQLGLGLILIVLALNAGLSAWNLRRIAEDERRAAHAHEVVVAIADTLSLLEDAETGQRGYLITGDPVYLEPYDAALSSIGDALRRLEALTADSPSQQSLIAAVEGHVASQLAELAETIRLRRELGFAAAREVVDHGIGRREMEAIRASFGAMRKEEVRLLQDRSAVSRWVFHSARVSNLLATALSFGLVGLVYLEIGRSVAERSRAEALQETDRRKDEFLAMLAHELRNPLAAIRAALDSIRLGSREGPELHRSSETIDRQLDHLSQLIEDLLDISRIAQGKLDLRREPLDLADAIDLAVEISRPLIDGRGHRLSISAPMEPLHLEGDRTRLAQVFANLLINAAKYSERGSRIWLEIAREGTQAVVKVRDEGQGIDPEMLPRVFGLFAQEDRGPDRPRDGLGIGLALVRRLVELHAGAVEARSEGPNRGSEFVVRLPLARVGPDPAAELRRLEEPALPASRPRRILLADDCEDFAEMYSIMLESLGYEVRIAYDGATAVEAAREFRPDAVLMDLGLPKLDGFEVAGQLRGQPETREALLVALSGRSEVEAQSRSRDAGFDHFLTKPIRFASVEEILASPHRAVAL
jgi:signal transduction histidine kinase/ActR/RegA family two-component response regulator